MADHYSRRCSIIAISHGSRPACSGRASRCAAPPPSARLWAPCWVGARHALGHLTRGGKALQPTITDDTFSFSRNLAAIATEAALDGIYAVHTNLSAAQFGAAATVKTYSSLAAVEHAFRSMKTVDLELRPVFHWTAPRVRAHVLLCMLAYYLDWHMRQRLAPILLDEHDPLARYAQRTSPVAKAKPSPAARYKAARKRTDPADGEPLPVHSFRTLLADLATLTRNAVRLGKAGFHIMLADPTNVQRRAFDLFGATRAA
jgi:hypothetical protein